MKTVILIISILLGFLTFGQEIKYNLMLKNPCTNQVEYGLLYHLEKSGKEFVIADTLGTISLAESGTYKLEAPLHGISQYVEIKLGNNIDTLRTLRLIECYEGGSHPTFFGYCCCDEKCEGKQKDFYNNGAVRIKGNFKNGHALGKLKKYYQNGRIQGIRKYGKKGILQWEKEFDTNGTRIKE